MSQTSLKFNLDTIIATLFILSSLSPYIHYVGRGDVLAYIIFSVWLLVVTFNGNNIFRILKVLATRQVEIVLLFVFMLFALFACLFITPTAKAFQFAMMPVSYFMIIVMDAYYFLKDHRYKLTILFISCLFLGIQGAVSIPYVINASDTVSRMYTSGELEGSELVDAMKHGVGSANFYASIVGIFFIGMGSVGKLSNWWLRTILKGSLAAILLSLLSASYSLVFWMLGIGSLILLIRSGWKKIRFSHMIFFVALVAGVVIFYNTFLANSQVIEPIQRKINMIKEGNVREDGRIDLATQSLNTFMEHPLFGIGVPEWGREKEIGEHLPWIDFAAHYGIIGFFPLLLFVVMLLKRNYNFYFKSRNNTYASVCLVGFAVYIISNFVDPTIIEPAMIIMLLLFASSIDNWVNKPSFKNTEQKGHEAYTLYQRSG
jgi:O-antigen ligase